MQVRRIRDDELAEAAAVYTGADDAEAARAAILDIARTHKWNAHFQFVAREDRVTGVLLYFPLPDGSWLCELPRVRYSFREEAVQRALLQAVAEAARAEGIEKLRIHAEPKHDRYGDLLCSCGWSRITRLDQMYCHVDELKKNPTDDLQWRQYPINDADDLLQLMCATQEDSMDVPEMEPGNYRSLAFFKPTDGRGICMWEAASHEDQTIGCLFTNLYPNENYAELRYMGLLPPHRGKGHGTRLTAHAQRLALDHKIDTLFVTVDCRNEAAIRIYERSGFAPAARFSLWVSWLKNNDT